jgi:hypothetical protein
VPELRRALVHRLVRTPLASTGSFRSVDQLFWMMVAVGMISVRAALHTVLLLVRTGPHRAGRTLLDRLPSIQPAWSLVRARAALPLLEKLVAAGDQDEHRLPDWFAPAVREIRLQRQSPAWAALSMSASQFGWATTNRTTPLPALGNASNTLTKVWSMPAHDGSILCLAMHGPSGRVFSSGRDGRILAWDSHTGRVDDRYALGGLRHA